MNIKIAVNHNQAESKRYQQSDTPTIYNFCVSVSLLFFPPPRTASLLLVSLRLSLPVGRDILSPCDSFIIEAARSKNETREYLLPLSVIYLFYSTQHFQIDRKTFYYGTELE